MTYRLTYVPCKNPNDALTVKCDTVSGLTELVIEDSDGNTAYCTVDRNELIKSLND